MAIFTLASASGSPGVTTTALGLAMAWPRPVLLVEADPTGGSGLLAGFWRGQRDQAGLLELVMAERHGVLADALPRMVLTIDDTQVSVLAGTKSHEQAGGLSRLWDPLLVLLQDLQGQDVIVDAGRLGLESSPQPLIRYSDVTLLVTGSSLTALAAARSWARTLAADVVPGHDAKLVLVGEGRPYRASEVSRVLDLPVMASIERDAKRAAVYSAGAPVPLSRFGGERGAARAFDQSAFVRSLRTLATALAPRDVSDEATSVSVGGARP